MSTQAKVQCDMCGVVMKGDWDTSRSWPRVYHGQTVQDFCMPCWRPIMEVMRRNFVDGLLLEAQGIKEETE